MKRIALKQSQIPEFLNGATTLRIPVGPQPVSYCDEEGRDRVKWLSRSGQAGGYGTAAFVSEFLVDCCPYPIGSLVALTETWRVYHTPGGQIEIEFKDGTVFGPFKVSDSRYARYTEHRQRVDDFNSPITMPAEFSRFKRRVVSVAVEHGELWDWVLTLEAL